jgi:hypothetical protein
LRDEPVPGHGYFFARRSKTSCAGRAPPGSRR